MAKFFCQLRSIIFSAMLLFFCAQAISASTDGDISVSHARILFRQGNYEAALLLIKNEQGLQALWLRAESLFRLKRYDDAKREYEKLKALERDELEQQKIAIRIFDSELLGGDLKAAMNAFDRYAARYHKNSPQMSYGLGKALYDAHRFKESFNILKGVGDANEFSMRARYLIAAMGLRSRDLSESIKLFAQIEAMKAISVEDYGVRALASLARARLLASNHDYLLAQKAYAKVPLNSPFGAEATSELIRMMWVKADSTLKGAGPWALVPVADREALAHEDLKVASAALGRFRKVKEVGRNEPELLTLMAMLLTKARRYDDARIAYGELIDHYRPIEEKLRTSKADKKIWPYFALNFEQKPGAVDKTPLIPGVAQSLLKNLPGLNKLTALKLKILADGQKLQLLEDRALLSQSEALIKAQKKQQEIIKEYEHLVLAEQNILAKESALIINEMLGEAEFRRAELSLLQIRDIKKKGDVVREYQNQATEQFKRDLKKISKDGSS